MIYSDQLDKFLNERGAVEQSTVGTIYRQFKLSDGTYFVVEQLLIDGTCRIYTLEEITGHVTKFKNNMS